MHGGTALSIVEGADDDRPIRIAIEEGDEDILPLPRCQHPRPSAARHRRDDAQPGAGGGLVRPNGMPATASRLAAMLA